MSTQVKDMTAAGTPVGTDLVYVQRDPTGTPLDRGMPFTTLGAGFITAVGGDAATVMVANTLYIAAMVAWATANRNYTLPASPVIGDRCAVLVQSGNATYSIIIKGNTGQTINGGSAASEWSRVFITSELIVLRYVASNTWIVEHDGRIAMKGLMHLTTTAGGEAAATMTYVTSAATPGVWTLDTNIGGIADIATSKYTARRACSANIEAFGASDQNVADSQYYGLGLEQNDTTTQMSPLFRPPVASGVAAYAVLKNFPMAAGDWMRLKYRSQAGSIGLVAVVYATTYSFVENL